jgi:2,4-dienoyl-CoA reductase-like NADH-dependent reductase (Old Yellow Enzyme family)/thioredoxin reductase
MVECSTRYSKLFQPGFIGSLRVRNRLIMAPMGTRLASEIGAVTERQIRYYRERAAGGVGTVIVECTAVDYPLGAGSPNNLAIHHNSHIGGHNELVEAIRSCGPKVFLQLYHVGRNARPANLQGLQPVAPSAVPCKFIGATPRALSKAEVGHVVEQFVEAALRARTAGYDGVELHGAHGYLIGAFMSRSSNLRRDGYGGDLPRRMKFPADIVRGIRETLGSAYPIMFRLSGAEFVKGGMDIEECKTAAMILEKAGVSAFDVSAGTYDSMPSAIEPMSYREGWKIPLAEAIKSAVNVPVMGVGVIRKPLFAEKVLEEKRVDFIGLGRALLADPQWPRKALEGREEEIVPCISCNECIGGRIFKDLHIRCAVNPLTGREWLDKPTENAVRRKKIFVVGGGPAGIFAALTARRRGHRVTLFEKAERLGGQLRLAEAPPGKEKVGWLREYLDREIRRAGVKVNLGRSVTAQSLVRGKPDAVILATGAVPAPPPFHVERRSRVLTAWEVLDGRKKLKDELLVVLGGGTVGCETALYLAPSNRRVTILEMRDAVGLDMEPISRMDLLTRLNGAHVEVLTGRKVARIERGRVIYSEEERKEDSIEVTAVVLAVGASPEGNLQQELEGKVHIVKSVGDCVKPRKIMDAVYEGFLAGSDL